MSLRSILLLAGYSLGVSLAGCTGGSGLDVTTQHNDVLRTGAYLAESTLTPQNVRARGMHVRYWVPPCHNPVPTAWGRPDPWDTKPIREVWNRPQPPALLTPYCLDGTILTQPLYVRDVAFHLRTTNGIFVATTNNFVYGLEASTGMQMWQTDLMQNTPPGRCNPDPRVFHGILCLSPDGVRATSVIDPQRRRLYVLFATKRDDPDATDCFHTGNGPADFRTIAECDFIHYRKTHGDMAYWLAMLDLNTGQILRTVHVEASRRRSDGVMVQFDAQAQLSHPALLLDHDSVYIAFGSVAYLEAAPTYEYQGWVMRYGASDLNFNGVFCTCAAPTLAKDQCKVASKGVPGATDKQGGAGIWQGGGGLASDPDGNVFLLVGNGRADLSARFFGDSFLKLLAPPYPLDPLGYTPPTPPEPADPLGQDPLDCTDADLGAGGPMMIPDTDLLVGGGKTGIMYLLERNKLRLRQQFVGSTNQYKPALRAETWDGGPHLHGSPTYWPGPSGSRFGFLYVWGEKDFLRAFPFDKTDHSVITDPWTKYSVLPVGAQTGPVRALEDTMPGGMLSISAIGGQQGSAIVWATLPDSDCAPGQPCVKPPTPSLPGWLYAFDAETLDLMWDGGFGWLIPGFVPPTIAEGVVFIAAGSEFEPRSSMLLAFELGEQDGSERRNPRQPPHQPVPGRTAYGPCASCHANANGVEEVPKLRPLAERYANEASVHAAAAASMSIVAPPLGFTRDRVFEGNGEQVYEAVADGGKLLWNARGAAAEFEEAGQSTQNRLSIRLTKDSVWSASDGSTAVTELERSAPAPDGTDAPWTLLKITKSSGRGLLEHEGYVQCVYTHAGLAPAKAPAKRGEIARVRYFAQCRLWSPLQ